MADTRTPQQRRYIMQSVGTHDTGPELIVRRLLFALGYRYRLQAKTLPGKRGAKCVSASDRWRAWRARSKRARRWGS